MMLRKNPFSHVPGNGNDNSKNNDSESPQLVAVAVDGDKNSQHALKWAADHILARGHIFILLHVRRQLTTILTPNGQYPPISEVEDVASAFSEQMDIQTQELLIPFQCFCRRRGLICREVIIDDMNISKAIVDFVLQHGVDKLVLGASSRSAFSRTFKQANLPSSVSKIAPEFCSVYVISKGKISSSRPATHPKIGHFSGLVNELDIAGSQFQSSKSETIVTNHLDAPRRFALINSTRAMYGSKDEDTWGHDQRNNDRGVSHAGEPNDLSFDSFASCPSPSRTSIDQRGSHSSGVLDGGSQQPHLLASSKNEKSYLEERSFELYRAVGCPSPSRTSIDQKGSYSPHVLDGGRQQPRLSASSNHENSYVEEQWKSFDFYKIVGRPSGYEHSPPIDETSRLKLELKVAVDNYHDTSHKAYYGKADDEPTMEDPWSETERTFEMNKKDEIRLRIQAAERKMEFQSGNAIESENNFLQKSGHKFSSDVQYKIYSIEEIKEVTNNFSESLKIGEGGYGPVFKSILDHIPVAIKIPRPDVARGMEQFQQEVEVLSSMRHPNLVLLMGACPEYGCLVYEYMDNGNLEDRLFCRSGTAALPWQLRFRIAAEIASSLLYLHQTKPEPLVHRDLKPANILLDDNFVSKITDVGLARLIPASTSTCTSQYLATAAAGTFCYIDPEYQKTGTVGVKSDVYALGIILLQLITARPPMGLAFNIENAMEMGSFEAMLDPKVPDWPVEETVKLAKLALMCAELRRRDRPDLASVVFPELNRLRELADLSLEIRGRD